MLNYSTQDVASLLTAQGEDPAKYDLNGLTDAYNNPTKYPGFIQQQHTQSQVPLTSPQAPGIAETAVRVAGRNIIPTVGGGLGYTGGSMLGGALAGLLTGGAEGSIVPGIGNVVGGVAGAIGGGLLASKLQEKSLQGIQSPEDYQTGIQAQQSGSEANPNTAFLAGVAPMLLMGRPGVGLDIANRLKGAALMGGTDLASQAIVNGTPLSDINYGNIVKSAATGALFNKPQLLGNSRLFGGLGNQEQTQSDETLTRPYGPNLPGGLITDKGRMLSYNPSISPRRQLVASNDPTQRSSIGQIRLPQGEAPSTSNPNLQQGSYLLTSPRVEMPLQQSGVIGPDNPVILTGQDIPILSNIARRAIPQMKAEQLQQIMQDNQIGNQSNIPDKGVNPQLSFTRNQDKANEEVAKAGDPEGEDEQGNSLYKRDYGSSVVNSLVKDNPDYLKLSQEQADKMGITVKQAQDLTDQDGNSVLGVYHIKQRVAEYDPTKGDPSTLPHELWHGAIRDMLESPNPYIRALVNQGIVLHGSEEAMVNHLGNSEVDLQREALANNKPSGWIDQAKQWFQDMWKQIKFHIGQVSSSDITRLLQKARGKFYEDPNHPIGKAGSFDTLLQKAKQQSKNNYIGTVDSYGSVKVKKLNENSNPFAYEHAYDVPGANARSEDRWRYTNDGKINWSDEPTKEAKEAVENYLIKNGASPKSHSFGGGIPDDVLFQHKSTLVKEEDKNNPLTRSKIGLPPSKLDKNQVSNTDGEDLLANEKGSIQAERPTPSFSLTRPAIEQVAKEEGNNTLSNSLSEAFKRQHEIEGQFTSQIPTALKLSHKEDLELEKLLQAGSNDNKDYSSYATNPKIAQAYKEARAMYDSVFQYANSTGKYIMDEGGPRDMYKVSNYHVQAGSPDLNSNLTKNPTGENSKAYLNDYYQHRLSKGDTIETAQKDLEGYKAKFQPQSLGGPGQTVMGAVRYPLGKTLPDSWDEPSALVKLKSYIQRTSKDFAWRESIESNPLIAKRMGYNDIVVKNPTTGAYETHSLKDVPVDKTNSQAAKTVFESFRGTHEAGEEIPNALGRLATSVTLGPLTGIHIAVSSAFKAMSYARPNELLDASKAMMKVDQGQIHAIENGVARGDIVGTASDHIDTMNGIARNLNNLADLVGKITGRSHLTLWSQGGAQSVGEFLTRQRIMQAKGGDREAAVFLNKLDPSFDYNKPLDNNIISKLGSQFVNLIHGSNDARTQPTWMLKEGFVAPFFKLMSWSMGQTNAFMKHVYEPASTYVKTGGKEGDYVPMIMATMGGVLGGAFIKYLREEVSGKEGPIPTLKEMVNDGKGFEDNIPIAAYQAMAYASYAGLAGVFSSIGKAGFDFAYKNKAQGAMFPLDEIISNSVKTGSDYFTAMINGDKSQWGQMTTHALMDYLNQNIQMSRIAMNHLAQSGINSELQNKYKVAVANRNLRAYEEVKGLPYQQQEASEANPYTEIGQKLFKQESNPAKAMQELPELIHDIFNRYGNQGVDVLRNKLASLKINNYRTIPSPENEPLTSMKYMDFVRRTQGTQAANNLFGDYMRQNLINKIKGSMVPQL